MRRSTTRSGSRKVYLNSRKGALICGRSPHNKRAPAGGLRGKPLRTPLQPAHIDNIGKEVSAICQFIIAPSK